MAEKIVHVGQADTVWGVVASDAAKYTSIANAVAAGKSLFPSIERGGRPATVWVRTENAAGADGAACYLALNRGTDFSGLANDGLRDDQGMLVSGAGQNHVRAGWTPVYTNSLRSVWVRKLTAGDEVIIMVEY